MISGGNWYHGIAARRGSSPYSVSLALRAQPGDLVAQHLLRCGTRQEVFERLSGLQLGDSLGLLGGALPPRGRLLSGGLELLGESMSCLGSHAGELGLQSTPCVHFEPRLGSEHRVGPLTLGLQPPGLNCVRSHATQLGFVPLGGLGALARKVGLGVRVSRGKRRCVSRIRRPVHLQHSLGNLGLKLLERLFPPEPPRPPPFAFPMILSPTSLQETTRRFLADSPLLLISGVLAMTAGLSIVNTHNVWVLDWPLIVTLFGWALAIGVASRIVAPHAVEHVGSAMIDRPTMTRIVGAFWALLGAFLTFKGYA